MYLQARLKNSKLPASSSLSNFRGQLTVKEAGLESIVHFYNTRDTKPRCETLGIVDATEREALANGCWRKPEFGEIIPLPNIPGNSRPAPVFGRNGLTAEQEAAIVAYLKSLSDLITPRRP